jgi:hypothetical protein
MPLDYFVSVIRDPTAAQRTIVVDTGMDASAAARRPGRVILTPVEEMLRWVGVDPAVVRNVVLTHMHFDHAGCIDLFPSATSTSKNPRWLFALAAACATGCCATRSRSTTSLPLCGASMMAACASMTARRRLLLGDQLAFDRWSFRRPAGRTSPDRSRVGRSCLGRSIFLGEHPYPKSISNRGGHGPDVGGLQHPRIFGRRPRPHHPRT